MDPWTPKFTKVDLDPNRVIRFFNKTNCRVIWLFTACAIDSEWAHMWPAADVNNDGRTDLPQTFTPYDPSCWSQLSSQVHSQRISGFLASYSADSNAWSNNFNTIFWSDEPTSDASGSWLQVVLNRQHNTKQKSHELVVCNWRATTYTSLETIRFSFRSGTIP